MFAGSAWRRIPADDEFLLVHTLELDPAAAAPPRFINGIAQFADYPFEAAAFHFRQ